jgi:hypothetical protein
MRTRHTPNTVYIRSRMYLYLGIQASSNQYISTQLATPIATLGSLRRPTEFPTLIVLKAQVPLPFDKVRDFLLHRAIQHLLLHCNMWRTVCVYYNYCTERRENDSKYIQHIYKTAMELVQFHCSIICRPSPARRIYQNCLTVISLYG